MILVGVANTGLRRMAEYTPTRDFKMGGGEGRSYGRLLIEELKPWIDKTYRTLGWAGEYRSGRVVAGWIDLALRGLCASGGVREAGGDVAFAVVGSPQHVGRFEKRRAKPDLRIWLDMGTAEGLGICGTPICWSSVL